LVSDLLFMEADYTHSKRQNASARRRFRLSAFERMINVRQQYLDATSRREPIASFYLGASKALSPTPWSVIHGNVAFLAPPGEGATTMAEGTSTHFEEEAVGAPGAVVALSDRERQELVTRKVTCPFLGPVVAGGRLPVRQEARRPLASIQEVRELGNSGGGNLGDVLAVFAEGNHAFMPGPTGALDQATPLGLFSLDLPGSQGSHPGNSGILHGDPNVPGSGRFSERDFDRLISRAENGLLKRSDVGAFIKENVERDPDATKFSARALLKGVVSTLAETVPAGLELLRNAITGEREGAEQRDLLEALTGNARASNLIGSAGEFGLLFAFLEHKPGSVRLDGEPTVSVEDLTLMFREKQLPPGWETWPKTKADWVKNTLALAHSAGLA
jgi:hypothetical protein